MFRRHNANFTRFDHKLKWKVATKECNYSTEQQFLEQETEIEFRFSRIIHAFCLIASLYVDLQQQLSILHTGHEVGLRLSGLVEVPARSTHDCHWSLFVFCFPPFFRSLRFFANELLNAKKNSSVRYGNCELLFFSVSLVTCIDNTQHNKHKLFMTTKKTERQLISCNNGKSRLPEHFRLPLPICVIFCNNLARVLLDSAAEASLIVHCYRQLILFCSCAMFTAEDKDKSSIALPKKLQQAKFFVLSISCMSYSRQLTV